ncbi:DUF4159 domain-containing protein [Candidatus Poribacteria bacterium]|nr:DUF4159 domain-containing protein [Candidatus Poribacteria bacterium]MYA57289.1 DUF4159 domain-containing protein [Candidatus Poribacteria bacterium]
MRGKITSSALMSSLVLHIVITIVAGLYLIAQTDQFKDLMGIEILYPKEPPKPKVERKFVVKPIIKPTVPRQNIVVGQIQVQPRVTTIFPRESNFQPQTVLEFSIQTVKVQPPTDPNVRTAIVLNPTVQTDVIHGDLLVSDAPDALAFSAPIVKVPSAQVRNVSRGIAGRLKVTLERSPGLSMVENVGAARDALSDVVENITLSSYVVPPLPKGEPGGRVIGKGKDIRGVLRFARVRHDLSDWWADASALNALTQWLNERTKIKTDMSVEGGAVKLNDANLFKTPLAFMTGHDPGLVRSREIFGWKHGTGRIDGRLSQSEAAGMRRYLVEKGGFLVFDDCGVNAPAQAMVRLFLSQMRYVMPEYHVERISNNHEIYNNFYAMGGPPVGYDIFWWGTRPPKRNFLEGISVGEKLSVIVVRRDYMCAMETVSYPTRSVHYSPGVYRFMTNVVVYALTHGSISDYSGYVPESVLTEKELPTRPPAAAKVGGFE